ncbi:MAG: hypothetical protein K6E10_07460 [Eubacterium sp.]|nr:hypothetical protein [Eubacterium sp.]
MSKRRKFGKSELSANEHTLDKQIEEDKGIDPYDLSDLSDQSDEFDEFDEIPETYESSEYESDDSESSGYSPNKYDSNKYDSNKYSKTNYDFEELDESEDLDEEILFEKSSKSKEYLDLDSLEEDLDIEDEEVEEEYRATRYSESKRKVEQKKNYDLEENTDEDFNMEEDLALDQEIQREIADAERKTETMDLTEDDYENYYGIEQVRPSRKIVPGEQKKTRSLRLHKYREQNLARFSNIYMLAGMIIGVAVFYFLVIPEIKNHYSEEIRDLETSYNQTISTKNNEIDNLNLEIEGLSNRNSVYESKQAEMQATIDNLTTEVETLKRTVESGGLTNQNALPADTVDPNAGENPPEGETGTEAQLSEEEQAAQAANAAAERNNANVIGISGNSIEEMISND